MTGTVRYNPTINLNGLGNFSPNRVNLRQKLIKIRFEGMPLVLSKILRPGNENFQEPPARRCKIMSSKMEKSAAPPARRVDFRFCGNENFGSASGKGCYFLVPKRIKDTSQ